MTSVTIGDILTYTTTLTNTGNTDATAVVFTDNIPDGTTFIDGSVLVNNIPQLNANPSAGILVGTITPNTSIPVTFSVTVVALPASGHVQNQSTSRYTINAEEQISTSNITFTEVISANVIATKTTPIQYADLQTIIPYTISIINNGNIQVENIIVTDIIPANTSFIENSVIVNAMLGQMTTLLTVYKLITFRLIRQQLFYSKYGLLRFHKQIQSLTRVQLNMNTRYQIDHLLPKLLFHQLPQQKLITRI